MLGKKAVVHCQPERSSVPGKRLYTVLTTCSHDLVGETGAQTGGHLAGELLALHTCGLLTGGPWRLKGLLDVLVTHPGVHTE